MDGTPRYVLGTDWGNVHEIRASTQIPKVIRVHYGYELHYSNSPSVGDGDPSLNCLRGGSWNTRLVITQTTYVRAPSGKVAIYDVRVVPPGGVGFAGAMEFCEAQPVLGDPIGSLPENPRLDLGPLPVAGGAAPSP